MVPRRACRVSLWRVGAAAPQESPNFRWGDVKWVFLIDATIASRGPIRSEFSLARHEYRRSSGRRHLLCCRGKRERHWSVRLPEGISAGSEQVVIASLGRKSNTGLQRLSGKNVQPMHPGRLTLLKFVKTSAKTYAS